MTVFLMPEFLTNVFSYFETDSRSLHSFLLVNRHWCINAVPILWRRTFYVTARGYSKSEGSRRLIATYLSCMPSKFLNLDARIESKRPHQVSPTFDYPSFLRGFDFAQVYHAIEHWYKYQSSDKKQSLSFIKIAGMDDDTCKIFLTAIELIKYILSRSPVIDFLALSKNILRRSPTIFYSALDIEATILSEFISTGKCQYDENCLAYIRKFVSYGNSNKCDLYKTLANVATNAENIKIYGIGIGDLQAEGLSSFIRKQRFLRKFVLWNGTKKQMPNVIKALSFNSGKLKYLEFRNCDFENLRPLELLANACSELTTLKFIQCGEISCYGIPSFSFTNLNILDLEGTHFPADALEILFCHANINLRTIIMKANSVRYSCMIEKLASYCPYLTKLVVRLCKDEMSQLDSLFRSCTRLETIIIQGQLPITQDVSDDLLINLCGLIPTNLKKFVVMTDCIFTASAVDTFLRGCKAKLNRLEFIYYGDVSQHLNVIKKYARRHELEIIDEIVGVYLESSLSELGHIIILFE